MPWPTLPDSIELLEDNYDSAYYERSDAQVAINSANIEWGLGNDHAAIGYLIAAAQGHNDCLDYMLTFVLPFSPTTLLPAILYQMRAEYSAAEYELTAKKICEAWAVDNFEFAPVTIAFIDRMRQLIWDEPFLAVWAREPEKEF